LPGSVFYALPGPRRDGKRGYESVASPWIDLVSEWDRRTSAAHARSRIPHWPTDYKLDDAGTRTLPKEQVFREAQIDRRELLLRPRAAASRSGASGGSCCRRSSPAEEIRGALWTLLSATRLLDSSKRARAPTVGRPRKGACRASQRRRCCPAVRAWWRL